jgi:hypothetical protein
MSHYGFFNGLFLLFNSLFLNVTSFFYSLTLTVFSSSWKLFFSFSTFFLFLFSVPELGVFGDVDWALFVTSSICAWILECLRKRDKSEVTNYSGTTILSTKEASICCLNKPLYLKTHLMSWCYQGSKIYEFIIDLDIIVASWILVSLAAIMYFVFDL